MSMKPGATIRPFASKVSAPLASVILPVEAISAMRSPSSRMSRGASVWDAGSSTRPFLIRSMSGFLGWRFGFAFKRRGSSFRRPAHQEIKNGHARRNAVGDLLENGRAWPIGNVWRNLRAAVNRARVKDQRVRLGEFHALGIELIQKDVIVLGKRGLSESFRLNSKHDDDVRVLERFFDAIDALDGRAGRTDVLELAGNPHGRSAKRETAAKFSEQVDVGTCHAGMRDIAQDGDVRLFNVPLRSRIVSASSNPCDGC